MNVQQNETINNFGALIGVGTALGLLALSAMAAPTIAPLIPAYLVGVYGIAATGTLIGCAVLAESTSIGIAKKTMAIAKKTQNILPNFSQTTPLFSKMSISLKSAFNRTKNKKECNSSIPNVPNNKVTLKIKK